MDESEDVSLEVDVEEIVNVVLEEEDKLLHLENPRGINDNIEKRIKELIN